MRLFPSLPLAHPLFAPTIWRSPSAGASILLALGSLASACSTNEDSTLSETHPDDTTGGGSGDDATGGASPSAGVAGTASGGTEEVGGAGSAGGSADLGEEPTKAGYQLIWHDEFDGPTVDSSKWRVHNSHEQWWPDMPNRRNYKASNVYIEEGAVVIRTIKESEGIYSTGSLDTARDKDSAGPHRFAHAFGYYEARMKFQTEPGHWPAFWLFDDPVNQVDGSGRDGTEIDIMEKAWLTDTISHALHWDGYEESHQGEIEYVTGRQVDDGGWHVVGVDWSPTEYVFYIDGVESWRTSAGGVCQIPLYIWLSEEITDDTGNPNWGAGPTSTANLPDYFRVDYVRVYEKL